MEENDASMVRFRLVFDDRHLLDKSLRSQGLRRCWFLLKPGIATVGELASHIRKSFSLHDRIVLFMDDFVLPSFESTSIITDKDIITVKKKEVKQKDICKPCDGRSLIKDSQVARIHNLPFSNDLLSDDKSEKKSHGSESNDKEKEKLLSCMETEVPSDVGLVKRKRKNSKKLLGSNGQPEDNNHDHEFEPINSPDVRKIDVLKKQADTQMLHQSSDREEIMTPFAVQPGYIRNLPQEHGTQEVDEVQPLLFDGSSSITVSNMNKENFSQTDNDRCFKIDQAPLGDGLLPLPVPKVMSSTDNVARPKPVQFESLPLLCRLPVKGDVLAYRRAEQSSSLHPELSPPQVGKVSSFDYKSLQITLLPVLEYEILLQDQIGATTQRNPSLTKEDESIEIDYSSLVDVRLLKTDDSGGASCQNVSAVKDSWEEALAKGNDSENISSAEQNNGWSQWTSNKSATGTSWSCKQPYAPFAGRGRGRTNRGLNRCMNTWTTNRNFNRNNPNWNPNICAANNNPPPLPWSFRPAGPPGLWDPYQNVNSQPGSKYSESGMQ